MGGIYIDNESSIKSMTGNIVAGGSDVRELRCKSCEKLLGKGVGALEIKCTRCKTLNKFEAQEAHTDTGVGNGRSS